jgi:hypothetical protein
MRRFSRASAVLLTAVLVISPIASAQPMLPRVLDEHVGEVDEDLQEANSTYGNRSEFQRATASLSRASLSLLNDAWIVSHDELVKANGGLETGLARAQASGSGSDQQIVDHGRQLASEARSELQRIRGSLDSMERTGLEPVAFSGGLTAAYTANRAMDLLREHDRGLQQWEKGNQNEQVKIAIVSGGAGAKLATSIASDVLERTTEARANASTSDLLTGDELDELVKDRVGWSEANAAPAAQPSRERVTSLADEDERLMALSAYTIYFQDVAFNGANMQQQRGKDIDAFQEAHDLVERDKPAVEAWVQQLDVPGDVALGAVASADFTLKLNQNATGQARNQSGAYALGMAHLGIEQAGQLVEAYSDLEHEPGTELVSPDASSQDEGLLSVPAPGALVAAVAAAFAAIRSRRAQR